jgi:outer membrane protein insertion porin family
LKSDAGSARTPPRPRTVLRAGSPRLAARIGAALLALAACALLSSPCRAQDGDIDVEQSVRRVELHGNESIGDGTLKKILRTKGRGGFPFYRKRPLRLDYIRFDRLALQDYYRRHGFLEARVDSVPIRFNAKGIKAEVHFYLTEGPRARVESVRFEGVGPVPENRLRSILELKPGDPLDIPKQDQSREAVHNEYTERGYVASVVRDSLEVEGTRVRIVYRVEAGPPTVLDSVIVEGTAGTRPKFVSREVTIDRGDLLRRSKLLLSQQRIYDTGFYNDVRFDRGDIDSATSSADLIINVRERKMGWIDAGIGYGTVDQLRLTSQLGQRNLWRAGVRLVGTGLLGVRVKRHPTVIKLGDSRADLALTEPWTLGVRIATTVDVYGEHIRPPSIAGVEVTPYRAYGASGALAYDFSLQTHSRLSYEHRNVVSDTTGNNLLSTSGDDIESYTTNRLVASLERDTRDNPFDPRRGIDLLGTSAFVGGALSGSAQFLKHTATAVAFTPTYKGTTAGFRIRAGLINPQAAEKAPPGIGLAPISLIPPEDRFFLGGGNTVRGYGENELGTRLQLGPNGEILEDANGVLPPVRVGGRVLLLVNAELRRRLFGPFGAEVFFDGGNVWERPSDVRLRNVLSFANGAGYNDMRYSIGAGLRFTTPIGPVRLDYAIKLRRSRFDQRDPTSNSWGAWHFSVGQAF